MRIKLDENIPGSFAEDLRELGHDVDTVVDEGVTGEPDTIVWGAAQDTGRFFITQDLDFSDIRRFEPGTHTGLLLLRLREPGRQALRERIAHLYRSEDVEAWRGAFVVATARRLRVRRSDPHGSDLTRPAVDANLVSPSRLLALAARPHRVEACAPRPLAPGVLALPPVG